MPAVWLVVDGRWLPQNKQRADEASGKPVGQHIGITSSRGAMLSRTQEVEVSAPQ